MFKFATRSLFLSKFNEESNIYPAVQTHLKLQQAGWPANEFIDTLITATKGRSDDLKESELSSLTLNQYLWVFENEPNALRYLWYFIDTHKNISPELYNWMHALVSASSVRNILNET